MNIKEIVFDSSIEGEVKLDTKITPELKEEGVIREIIRNIQQIRKERGCTPKDAILIQFKGGVKIKSLLFKNKEKIITETKAKDLVESKGGKFKARKKLDIEGEKLQLSIKKVKT